MALNWLFRLLIPLIISTLQPFLIEGYFVSLGNKQTKEIMPNKVDLQGQVFGRWTVLAESKVRIGGGVTWECLCECGTSRPVVGTTLRKGESMSCGCLHKELTSALFKKHGETGKGETKEHRAWHHMLSRCRNVNEPSYPRYGGRGITVCPQWGAFESFLADMGRAPSATHSLERIDNDGNYEPANCKWATQSEQANNTSQVRLYELNGVTKSIKAWAREMGVHPATFRYHLLNKGRTLAEIAQLKGYTT